MTARVPLLGIVAASVMASCAGAEGTTAPSSAGESAGQIVNSVRLIGIHATGPQVDLDRLQAVATAAGFPSKQMDGPEGWQLVIVIPPQTGDETVRSFVERLRGADFATLQFRSAIAPPQ